MNTLNDSISMKDLFLRLHAQQTTNVRVSMILMGAFVLLPIPNDFHFIEHAPVLIASISLRFFIATTLFLYYLAYSRKRYTTLFYVIIPVLSVLTIALNSVIDLTRPSDWLFGSVSVFVILAVYYFIMHSSTLLKTVPALLITGEQAWALIWYKDIPPAGILTMLLSLVLINVFGISSSLVMNRLQVIALKTEKELREELILKEALASSGFDISLLVRGDLLVDCSKAFTALVGLSLEQVRSLPISWFFSLAEGDRGKLAAGETVTTRLNGGDKQIVELRQRTLTLGEQEYGYILIRKVTEKTMPVELTQREKEVATLIVEGKSRTQIARILNVSDETVKTHTSNIYEKLDVSSKIDLIHKLRR